MNYEGFEFKDLEDLSCLLFYELGAGQRRRNI